MILTRGPKSCLGWIAVCDVCGRLGPLETNVPECMHYSMHGWEMSPIACRPPDPKHPARCPVCVKAGLTERPKQPRPAPPPKAESELDFARKPASEPWRQAELFAEET